jgi:uncharacterized protein YukE
MSFEGMDVDQLQGLAKQIESDAQVLYNLVTDLTGAVGGLTLLWHGPMAATFEQDWQSKNRPALLAAYNTLRDLHAHLVSNISQQTSASAAEGGWTAERVIGDFENLLTGAGLVGLTPLLHGTPVEGLLTGAGLISLPISAYHTADDAFHVDEDLVQGHYVKAANDVTDEISDGLKTASGIISAAPLIAATPFLADAPFIADSPLLADGLLVAADPEAAAAVAVVAATVYVAGVDVKLLDQVANLDWKDTPNPFSGSNFQQDYVPVFESMGTGAFWEQAGKTLWKDL